MTPDMVMTLCVLAFVIVLFIFEWVRVDVVGLIVMVILPMLGLISAEEAFVGLSSNAVVSIIAVIIIGAGLDNTGIMHKLSDFIIKISGNKQNRIVILISATVGLISSMMQNIGATALFLPAAKRVSKEVKMSVSHILMPMGFCAIIGGTITLIGASPTILLNDLMAQSGHGYEPFGMFTQTPIGLCLLASAILYFALLGKYVVPNSNGDNGEPEFCQITYHADFMHLPKEHFITKYSHLAEHEELRQHKVVYAIVCLVIALVQVVFFDVRLSTALMSGAIGMIVTGVITIDEAYKAVDWMTVFLLAGLIPLGLAFERTGTAALIANGALNMIGNPSPMILYAVIGLLTSAFTLVVSNVGATILVVPICMNMAMVAGVDPRISILVVGISASNTFVLPTHQVNALVMSPGGYCVKDYVKAGTIMTILFLTVELSAIYLFY